MKVQQRTLEYGQSHNYKLGRKGSKHKIKTIKQRDSFLLILLHWVALLWKSVKSVVSTSKRVHFRVLFALKLLVFRVPARASPWTACLVFWTAFLAGTLAKTCSFYHVSFERIFGRFSENYFLYCSWIALGKNFSYSWVWFSNCLGSVWWNFCFENP